MKEKVKYHSHRSGTVFGVILMVVGMLFLALNLGWLESGYRRVIFSWPMLLILIGIISYFYRHFFSGSVLIITGVFFIIPRLAIVNPEAFYWVTSGFACRYWGILLIISGILVILQITFRPKRKNYKVEDNYVHERTDHHILSSSLSGKLDRNSVFANVEEIILNPVFQGGEINVVFGGITLDLRKTSLPEGETKLEVNTVFGGIEIYVPENWYVELHLSHVFGGFVDKRFFGINTNIDTARKLIIHGGCVFGGGEIRN